MIIQIVVAVYSEVDILQRWMMMMRWRTRGWIFYVFQPFTLVASASEEVAYEVDIYIEYLRYKS